MASGSICPASAAAMVTAFSSLFRNRSLAARFRCRSASISVAAFVRSNPSSETVGGLARWRVFMAVSSKARDDDFRNGKVLLDSTSSPFITSSSDPGNAWQR